jgi:hypothetical protein
MFLAALEKANTVLKGRLWSMATATFSDRLRKALKAAGK